MARILLLSYHFPPFNVIASQRPWAYFQYLPEYGHEVDVATMDWKALPEGNGFEVFEGDDPITEQRNQGSVYRLRAKSEKGRSIGKREQIKRWRKGKLDAVSLDNVEEAYHRFLTNHLASHRYDLILGIFSPHFHLKHSAEFGDRFDIPYVLDFRDLWSNRIIHRQYKPSLGLRLEDHFIGKHWRKWLGGSSFATITSKPWADLLQGYSTSPVEVVRNGYIEEEMPSKGACSTPLISYVGSMYQDQRWDMILQGIKEALSQQEFQIQFIGSDIPSSGEGLTARLKDPKQRITKYLSKDQFRITEKLPREKALKALSNSSILLFASFPDIPGWYSGKFLEYLGSGTPILVAPDDHSVVGEAIRETGAGRVANSPKEIAAAIRSMLSEPVEVNQERLSEYSRKAQVAHLAQLIQKHITL